MDSLAEIEDDPLGLSTESKAQLRLLLSGLKTTKEGNFLSGYQANEDGVMGETAEASSSIISLD